MFWSKKLFGLLRLKKRREQIDSIFVFLLLNELLSLLIPWVLLELCRHLLRVKHSNFNFKKSVRSKIDRFIEWLQNKRSKDRIWGRSFIMSLEDQSEPFLSL